MRTAWPDTELTSTFEKELEDICAFYKLDAQELYTRLSLLSEHFGKYLEMVFSEQEFELITAGRGNTFAETIQLVAQQNGLSKKTILFFEACRAAFPDAISGIKLCFSHKGEVKPTLYVRTKIESERVYALLEHYLDSLEILSLKEALHDNSIIYGLGLSEKNKAMYLKTYTLNTVVSPAGKAVKGFVSLRMSDGKLLKEHKTYLPDVGLAEFQPPTQGFKELLNFLTKKMKYTTAGHIGMLHEDHTMPTFKIYIERTGGIPTDFSAK